MDLDNHYWNKKKIKIHEIFSDISNNFTYEFWVKPSARIRIPKESSSGVWGKRQRWVIGAGHGGNRNKIAGAGVSVGLNGIAVFEHCVNYLPATLVYPYKISDWTHVAVVYQNKTPSLYINGAFVKRGLTSPKRKVFPSGMIGFLESYGYFVGQLDNVRIWNYARSQSEISSNINKELQDNEHGLLVNLNGEIEKIQKDEQVVSKPSITNSNPITFPEKKSPALVSIIIPVFNNWQYTHSCLHSIYKNTNGINYEVIIADDMSTDETINIKDYFNNINLIRDGENRGFLKNCNNAAKHAKGKYLLFLNNDTNVQKDWLKNLVSLMEKDNNIGMAGSKLIYPNGKLQEAGGIIWKDASASNYGRFDNPGQPEFNYVKEVDYISGASIIIRNFLWEKIGGFDERYTPAYYEDVDLAFNVRKFGYKVMYQPKSEVIHFEGISQGTNTGKGLKHHQVENQKVFYKKWKSDLEENHFDQGNNLFHARERSKNKKTILVIDHYVPHFDQDAGSKSMYQYLKLFMEMGFNVKFLGDNFQKHEPYTTHLEQMGIEVLYGEKYRREYKKWLERNNAHIDYIYLLRPHIAVKYIVFLKNHMRAKLLYFGVDLHYLREYRKYKLNKQRSALLSYQKTKKMEEEIFKLAHVVYYPSQAEVDVIMKDHPETNAKVIPAYIYDHNQATTNTTVGKDLLFVGGFNHEPNVDAVLWFAKNIFPKIKSDIPDIRLHVIGSNPPEEVSRLHSNDINITGFVTDEQLNNYYKQCRLVVVPLRFGAGIKGKIVEAMYHQVPVVTTSIGAEGFFKSESILTIADQPDQFAKKVMKVYKNEQIINKINIDSLNYVKNFFSKENALSVIKKDLIP